MLTYLYTAYIYCMEYCMDDMTLDSFFGL
jgi:hypothetical protein